MRACPAFHVFEITQDGFRYAGNDDRRAIEYVGEVLNEWNVENVLQEKDKVARDAHRPLQWQLVGGVETRVEEEEAHDHDEDDNDVEHDEEIFRVRCWIILIADVRID